MAEADTVDVEKEAKQLGWVPKELYKGPEEHWIDAEAYVTRGKQMLPLLRKHNERLQGQVHTLNSQLTEVQKALKDAQDSMKALVEFQTEETKRQVEKAKRELKRQLISARKENDVDLEVEIEGEIERLDEGLKKSPITSLQDTIARREQPKPPAAPAESAAFKDFKENTPWFNTDEEMTAFAIARGRKIRQQVLAAGETLSEAEFYERAARETEEFFDRRSRRPSKVESGGPTGNRSSGSSYSDLPVDVKKQCDDQGKRLVGPNKVFKTNEAWRAHYAKMYFEAA